MTKATLNKMKQILTKKGASKKIVNAAKKSSLSNNRNPTFGAVSTINTAPVAIGNSLTGFQTRTVVTREGLRVVGRDFGFTVISTGTVTNWCLAGGLPTSPYAFTSSVLQNTSRMYNRYKPRRLIFHYITSSATSQTGDVMFYLRKNEGSTMPNNTSSTFLNYVLSDSNTVIGPQWTNHTCTFDTNNCPWLSTDYGATSETNSYNQYDLFLYSKTSSANSPGYIIVDYEFEFKEIAINPRAGNLAQISGSKAIWQPFSLFIDAAMTAGSSTLRGSYAGVIGVGATTITAPASDEGDVWEIILDVTNSTIVTPTAPTLANAILAAGTTQVNAQATKAITITDGMVVYCVDTGSSVWILYGTKDAAFNCWGGLLAQTTATYNTTLRGMCRLVGSTSPLDLKYSQ